MKKKYAFTFIEIMITIVIFSVGVLAVLSLVTNNLKSMDSNNLRLQATLLAKEWMELVYNLRDSNVEKQLSWNCLMNPDMYSWNSEELANKIWRWNQSDFETVICKWYFGPDNYLKVSFDPFVYTYYELSEKKNDFFSNYENNQLYLFQDASGLPWYGHSLVSSWEKTNFARYISFMPVKEWDNILPQDKIMKVESRVLYLKWATTWEVVFESFIWNY